MNGLRILGRHRIMRQVHVEVEGCNPIEQATGIEICHNGQRSDLPGSRVPQRPETVTILDGYTESFHQGTRIQAEALLAGNQSVAVVAVLLLALREIARASDVMVRAEDQTGPLARQELPDGLDLGRTVAIDPAAILADPNRELRLRRLVQRSPVSTVRGIRSR